MNHQSELEKKKYRNWVRGGLAYKYLKEGIERFADDAVQQEHRRIFGAVSHTSGLACNQCCLGNLRPLHKCATDPVTGRSKCYWGQSSCNCLYTKKQPCPNKVCDNIMEDILKGHGSTPPTPNWKNTDIKKWCSNPWEIAKCYINAPGYSDKTTAADIDTPGLLHVFINNINLHTHFSDKMNRSNTFKKTLQRRNELFHSPSMEMDDAKLNECIDEIIAILGDDKELKVRNDAQQAVVKLKKLKQESFIITTHNEVEVCRDALVSITNKSEELKQTIQDAKDDIGIKQTETKEAIDDKANECRDTVVSITNQTTAELKQTIQDAKDDIRLKQTEVKEATEGNVKECQDAVASVTIKAVELKRTIEEVKADVGKQQAEAIEAIKDKTQIALQQIDKHSETLYERVRQLEIDNSLSKQRLTVLESKMDELDIIRQDHQKQLEYVEEKQVLQTKLVEFYQNHYVKTSVSPLKAQENDINIKDVYVAPEMEVEVKLDRCAEYSANKPRNIYSILSYESDRMSRSDKNKLETRNITGYREILRTNGQKHKQIYIVGDVGTGKSSFCKMMIQNWCSAVTCREAAVSENYDEPVIDMDIVSDKDEKYIYIMNESSVHNKYENFASDKAKSIDSVSDDDSELPDLYDSEDSEMIDNSDSVEIWQDSEIRCQAHDKLSESISADINEMRNYDFVFFVPLQRMSGLSDITEMIKAILTKSDISSNDLIVKIFEQESERCLIIADGLDEWTPPKGASVLQHVSFGLPNKDRAKHATLVTLSRPSARGILNMRSTECDQKVELLGLNKESMVHFIKTYMSKVNETGLSYRIFLEKINSAKIEHLEKTPLLLKQLVWLYCTRNEIGKSISDAYSHLVNIMLGWSQNKQEGDDIEEDLICVTKQDKDMKLPRLLRRFPKCEESKGFLLPLARIAFEALTSEMRSTTFGRKHLRQKGVSKEAIAALIKFGILVENNCFDPTLENTQLEFLHMSYLEFFAAVYVTSNFNKQNCSILPNTVLQDLFQKCNSAADVLQLSNVLKMIFGLSPFLITELSKLVSDIVSGDKSMITYRKSLQKYSISLNAYSHYEQVSGQIQHLILNSLSEYDSDDQPMVSLCDVFIGRTREMPFINKIIPENVLSLHVMAISDVEVWIWATRLTRVQYMFIDNIVLPHSEMLLMSSLIEAPLKHLSLGKVRCNYSECHGHNIDLSKHDQLQKVRLRGCEQVIITNINAKHLEILRLDYFSISCIGCLLNASNLTELAILHAYGSYGGYDERVNSVVHTLQTLRQLILHEVDIADCALTVTPEMRNLKHIKQRFVHMSLQTWSTFVDSLLTLRQSVQVDYKDNSFYLWRDSDTRNYVRRNTIMFEVMEDEQCFFSFRTKK